MGNKRLYYAVQSVAFSPVGTVNPASADFMHGVQSVGMTTNFNLDQIFEIGQLAIYENIEQIPNIQMTVEKVLDGYPTVYQQATYGAASASLAGRSTVKTIGYLHTFDDAYDNASGVPQARVACSGLFVSSLNISLPVEGSCTESVTLVGNNKVWAINGLSAVPSVFDGTDQPRAITGSGGVQRRENVLFIPVSGTLPITRDVNGMVNTNKCSILPPDIDGVSSSGLNEKDSNGDFGAHIQSISISTDLGRQELFELGRRGPYHRFVNFPVQVTCEITTNAVRYDGVSATEDGVLSGSDLGNNLTNRTIKIRMTEGLQFDLGTKNKLSAVNMTGGDAGGGNTTLSYTYQNFNDLIVASPYDPTVGIRIPVP